MFTTFTRDRSRAGDAGTDYTIQLQLLHHQRQTKVPGGQATTLAPLVPIPVPPVTEPGTPETPTPETPTEPEIPPEEETGNTICQDPAKCRATRMWRTCIRRRIKNRC